MRDQDLFLQRALLEEGLVTPEQIDCARRHAAEHGTDLVDALAATDSIDRHDIARVKANVCEVPYVDLADYEPCYDNTRIVPRSIADRHCVFPMFMLDGVLTLAMDDPLNLDATDQIRQVARCEVDAVLAERKQIRSLITKVYSLSHARNDEIELETEPDADQADIQEPSQPVIAAVNQMLADAVDQRASDVHLNPDENDLHIRYRVDGELHTKQGPPVSMHPALVQRLKVMARLDLTQTRRPQDGKFRFRHNGNPIDVRMSTMPTVCGENVVIRLLPQSQSIQDFAELGVPAPVVDQLEHMLHQPYGMILVTGPTGSGKTTTLYTALSKLNSPSRNIMTIEDPVEIRLPYIRQIQVNPDIGLTFAGALRSVLRQDPDVVLLGEIRDNETATIALQAALTGHLVLATLHTNDALGAVARLRNYSLPPFVINSAVLGVIAQRLVRRVCQHCTSPTTPNELLRRRFKLNDDEARQESAGERATGYAEGKGCNQCSQTGYRGRLGIYELLPFTPAIQTLVEQDVAVETIRAQAVEQGMRLMWQDGLDKARLGQTTLDEVAKAASIIATEQMNLEQVKGDLPCSPAPKSIAPTDRLRKSA